MKNITHDIQSIIDASEVLIETPKNPDDQKKTWSDDKHDNTLNLVYYQFFL